jgi:hypothetical protein
MVCNPVPPILVHVPDFHALAICPTCRERRPVPHFDLETSGRALDGTAEWICAGCKTKKSVKPNSQS